MNLDFTPAQEIQTQQGVRWVQTAIPTQRFWKEWRSNQGALAMAGISVSKTEEGYKVIRMLTSNPNITEAIPAEVRPYMISKSRKFLLEFQPKIVSQLCASLINNGIAIDGSDAGVGKTYHALAVCCELNLRPAVICTKTGIIAWKEVCNHFGITPLFIVNWESVIARKYKTGEVKCSFPYVKAHVNKYTGRLWYEWDFPRNNTIALIFDECHKGNGHGTSQGKVFMAARNQRMICLSATLAESPDNMRNIGVHCGLFEYENFHLWLQKLGCFKSQWGNKWESASATQDMQRVSHMIFPKFGGRLRKADIPGFPDIQNIAASYPIKDVKKHNAAYQKLIHDLNNQESIRLLYKGRREVETDKAKLAELLTKMNEAQANKMVLNLRFRQLTEMLKVELFVELAKEQIENGASVAIFVNFTETLQMLAKKLKCDCLVHGGQTGKGGMRERKNAIENFQSDKARIIICNIAAGGISISLHDITGRHNRVSLISPTYYAKQMVQVLGRIHRSGAKSKAINRLIYAAGTVETEVCQAVSGKIDAINSLNDADLAEKDIFNLMKGG